MFRASHRIDNAHSSDIWSICWHGDHILTGSLDGTAKVWSADNDFKTGIASPARRMGIVSAIMLSDASLAITREQDSSIRFYNMADQMQEEGIIEAGLFQAHKLCISPDDQVIASGTQKGEVNVWSVVDKEKIARLESSSKFILDCAFNSDGTKIATSSIDGSINIFDLETRKVLHKIEAHALPARSIVFQGNVLFSASDDRHVVLTDVNSATVINSFSHSGLALSVDPSPDQKRFVVGCSNHSVFLWDLGMQRCQQTLSAQHSDQVWGVAFDKYDPHGKRFASVGEDGVMQLYELS